MAILDIYADARRRAISRAAMAKQDWPAEWLADLHAAYSVLAAHPYGSEPQAVMHYDFLKWLDARGEAESALTGALRRYPESWQLHARLRDFALAQRGVAGLESAYDSWMQREDAPRTLAWYAGYASLVAAEYQRRNAAPEEAMAAYRRCIERFEQCIAKAPETQANSDVYIALALAGQARLALEAGQLPRSLELLQASFTRDPGSAGTQDGLWLSGVATARTLRARLAEAGDTTRVEQLDAALKSLPPEELERPEWDREVPGGARGRQGLRRGERRQR
jgi:tetratricopeptide (TPR) repeat protein